MSSPIAKHTAEIKFIHKIINAFHQKLSHGRRKDILAKILVKYFSDIVGNRTSVKCIDVGCGDLGIMEIIANNVPETNWNCLDIYDLPKNLRDSEKWSCYKKFNGKDLPFADNSIDIVLFCDVLHHANENINYLLKSTYIRGKYHHKG